MSSLLAHYARQFDAEKAKQVLARFTAAIEEPLDSENVISINGEDPFDVQLAAFQAGLLAIEHRQ